MKYERARKMYIGEAKPKSDIPTYSKSDLKSNGWSDAQIAQAVKEGKIKVK